MLKNAQTVFVYMSVLILALLSLAGTLTADESSEWGWAEDEGTYTWKAIGGDYMWVCYQSGGGLRCKNTCPSGLICAEFVNVFGEVVMSCCISSSSLNSSSVSDCVTEIELVRGGPIEFYGSDMVEHDNTGNNHNQGNAGGGENGEETGEDDGW